MTMTTQAGELLEERRRHRLRLIRMALLYTPGAVFVLVLFGISMTSLFQGKAGAIIPAFILGLVGTALVFQSVAALRDLRAQPRTTTGTIRRAWSKGMMLGFFRTYYVHVDRAVFDISIVSFAQVQEGDRIEVYHWPHTKTVITVHKLKAEREQTPEEREAAIRRLEPKRAEFEMPDIVDTNMTMRYGSLWWKVRGLFWRPWRKR